MRGKKSILFILLCSLLFFLGFSYQKGKNDQKRFRPIEIADILAWKYIGSSALSPDGGWFAYGISSREGNCEVVIKKTKEEKEYRYPINVSGIIFSEDSTWVAFTIRPTRAEEEKLERQKKKIYFKVGLVNLSTGKLVEFDKVQRFSFSGEKGTWLALQKYPPQTQEKKKEKPKGSTLILYELATSKELSIGNVSEFAFDRTGRWLAWTIDAYDQIGNGIQLRDMDTGEFLLLESDKAFYSSLSWAEKGDGLIALKGIEDKNHLDRLYSIVGFRNFSKKHPQKVIYPTLEDKNFPEGMTISPNRDPEWTDDLSGFLFGIHKVKKKKTKEEEDIDKNTIDKSKTENSEEVEEELPDLVLWHWLDKRLQSQQQVEEKKDREFNFLCVYWVDEEKFVRLADEELKEVISAPKQRWAIGLENREYEYKSTLDGRDFYDFYVIDMKTGSRRLAIKKNEKFQRPRWYYSFSPDGTHFLYYKDGHFYAYEMESGKKYNITQDVPTSFINKEINYNLVSPPIQPFGWDRDSRFVLLYDNWDVWKVHVHGGEGINLTGNGKKEGIRYRERYQLDPEEKGIDLSGSVYFEVYGEWTKKSGIARIDRGKPGVKLFLWDDAIYYRFQKAKKSANYLYSRETFDDYDIYITDNSFQNGKRMTKITDQQKGFLWSSGSALIDYTSTKGDKLQAALFLPADYEKGKSYPTVVHIYERRQSSQLNRYLVPGIGAVNKSYYTSQGYAVLMPDINNQVNDPVMSALWCVLPAIEAAIDTGVVDRDRIGIYGHSMGGWETAFLITQTDIFKAAVAGASLTDLISMYGSIYGMTGGCNSAIFESSQGRIDRNYCENLEPFIRNSPVLHANKVKTPLLILHNDKDDAVNWNQGVEYFNILRRLQKPVVMLQYKGEGHSLREFTNQLDYCLRMKEFFDHYIKDKPAPEWLKKGVPHLEMISHLKRRAQKFSVSEN